MNKKVFLFSALLLCTSQSLYCKRKAKKSICKRETRNLEFQGSTSNDFIPLQKNSSAVTLRIKKVCQSQGIVLGKKGKSLKVECDAAYNVAFTLQLETRRDITQPNATICTWLETSEDCCNWTIVENTTQCWVPGDTPFDLTTFGILPLQKGNCIRFRAHSTDPNIVGTKLCVKVCEMCTPSCTLKKTAKR